MDLTTCDEEGNPWDFTKKHMRDKAERLLGETEPDLLVGSPPCTWWSAWQRLNHSKNFPRDWKKFKRLGRYLVGRPRVVTSYPGKRK